MFLKMTFFFLINFNLIPATFIFIKGNVQVKQEKWVQAKSGMSIDIGQQIKTDSKATAIIRLENELEIKLRSETTLTLKDYSKEESKSSSISLLQGSFFSKVAKQKSGQKIIFTTPTATAGVRGTQFFMAYNENVSQNKLPETILCVKEGTVEVTPIDGTIANEKKSKLIHQGEGIVYVKGKSFPKPEKLPWINDLNWNMDSAAGSIADETDLKKVYKSGYDLLDQDYD